MIQTYRTTVLHEEAGGADLRIHTTMLVSTSTHPVLALGIAHHFQSPLQKYLSRIDRLLSALNSIER
jgi:hypothetical protein